MTGCKIEKKNRMKHETYLLRVVEAMDASGIDGVAVLTRERNEDIPADAYFKVIGPGRSFI